MKGGLCLDLVRYRRPVWLLLCCYIPFVTSWISAKPWRRLLMCRPQHHPTTTSLRSASLTGIASTGISSNELEPVYKAVVDVCQDHDLTAISVDDGMIVLEAPINTTKIPLGATGRAMLLRASHDLSEENCFELQCLISQELDELIYVNPPILSQPVILTIERNLPESLSQDEIEETLAAKIGEDVKQYEMNVALPCNPNSTIGNTFVPTLRVEVDGALVKYPSEEGDTFWDTSSILVFDNLISDNLRRRLLNVVLGRDDNDSFAWNDKEKGPDPSRWQRGGLLDVPNEQQERETDENGSCWGLNEDAITELCFEHHDALQESETIISALFPQFTVTRLPEAVLGSAVSPLTANAATFGDAFDWHIDADPNLTPPSPWTDVYGRYPNRCKGKPRFMSCLVYLSEDWKCEEWGAPTRFVDVATDTTYDVQAKPGRVVFMDQDITHSVVAPLEAAGKRPRYSLVWKLILHPKHSNQGMTDLAMNREWPEPLLLGSAAAKIKKKHLA